MTHELQHLGCHAYSIVVDRLENLERLIFRSDTNLTPMHTNNLLDILASNLDCYAGELAFDVIADDVSESSTVVVDVVRERLQRLEASPGVAPQLLSCFR